MAVVEYRGEEGKTGRRIWVGALLTFARGGLWVGAASSYFIRFRKLFAAVQAAGYFTSGRLLARAGHETAASRPVKKR